MDPPWRPPPWPGDGDGDRPIKRYKVQHDTNTPTTPDQHTYEKAHQNLIEQRRNDEVQDWANTLAMKISTAIHEALSKEIEQLTQQLVFENPPHSATTPAETVTRATTAAPPEQPAVVPNPEVPNPTAPLTDFAPCCFKSNESTNPATTQEQDEEPQKSTYSIPAPHSPRIINPVPTSNLDPPAFRPDEKPPYLYNCCTTAAVREIVFAHKRLHHITKPPSPTIDNLQDVWIRANDSTKHNPIDRGPLVLHSLPRRRQQQQQRLQN